MKKRIIGFITAAMMIAALLPTAVAFGADYGKAETRSDGSLVLTFGADSIVQSGGGSVGDDADNSGYIRPDNLKTDDSGTAVLALPDVTLKNSGYTTVDLYAACQKDMAVSVTVGGTEVAKFDNVNNGQWHTYTLYTQSLKTADADGAVALNITGSAKTYCGNYVYLRFYGSGTIETATPSPASTPKATEPAEVEENPPYLDTSLSFEERAADLVSRMTLEEKVSQTGHSAPEIKRLGVHSYYYWREGLHGVARQGKATSFPTSLSMSNTWDRQLIYDCASITSDEARAKNSQYDLSYWSPTINMARDPRWGRNDETYGEDPYLTAQLGGMFVDGMQGSDEKYLKVIATLKHFAANNCENERSSGTSYMDEETMRDYYLDAFKDIVETNHPASVMSSYNATTVMRSGNVLYDYIASSANSYLLTDRLRRNWGFDGYVTGDCGAFSNLWSKSELRAGLFAGEKEQSQEKAMAKAFIAGNNIDCGTVSQSSTYKAVTNGDLDENILDRAVYELFLTRMRTGEFDSADSSDTLKSYRSHTTSELESEDHIAKAEQAAEESWVLLKNDNSILPVKKKDNEKLNIAVVGSRAGSVILGDYSGSPEDTISPYDGLLAQYGDDAEINYLGGFSDSEPLFDLNSITYNYSDGTTKTVNPSTGGYLTGATKDGNILKDVTKALDVRYSADCSKIESVTVNVTTKAGIPDLTLNMLYNAKYGEGPNVCSIKISDTNGAAQDFTGTYTGASGGYNSSSATLYLGVEPGSSFSVDKFKTELDEADVIIAYAGTTLADSSESNDRESIALPDSQSHVKEICAVPEYAAKTITAIQAVGQVDISDFSDSAAILWTSYNGQTQGEAFAKIIDGTVNPSGKLTTTWYDPSDLSGTLKISSDGTIKSPTGLSSKKYNNYNIKNTSSFAGRTYQYYTGDAVYPFGYGLSYTTFGYSNLKLDKTSADANDVINVSFDVTNTGDTAGTEVVQLYASMPDDDTPKKQLKGFKRVTLNAGETKNVTLQLDLSDCTMFSESDQKMYVPNGNYTVYIGGSSADEKLSASLNVSGTLSAELKTVKAIPSGIKVTGVYNKTTNTTKAKQNVTPNLSAVLADDSVYEIQSGEVVYTSSNESVATVAEDGTVSAGTSEGTAVITATVTVNGVSESETFPVVCELSNTITQEALDEAIEELTEEYNTYTPESYTAENYEKLTEIYNDAVSSLKAAMANGEEESALSPIIEDAKNSFKEVETLPLSNVYTIASENENVLVNGVVDYRSGGLEPYVAETGKISGTVTGDSPYSFKLIAKNGSETVNQDDLKWTIESIDNNSTRKPAELSSDGTMTIYGYGLYKVTASNPKKLECGEITILVNTQIEAELADDTGGARLESGKGGASGNSDYNDIGSSKEYWLTYNNVKVTDLESITLRLSMKNSNDPLKVTYVSLAKNTDSENLLTKVEVPQTGSWTKWQELTGTVDQDVLKNAKTDENGLCTIYVQTNTANFDFMKLTYDESSIAPTPAPVVTEAPATATPAPTATPASSGGYTIEKAEFDASGSLSVVLSYGGSEASPTAKLIVAEYEQNNESVLLNQAMYDVEGTNIKDLDYKYNDGTSVKIFLWDDTDTVKPLTEAKSVAAPVTASDLTLK